MKRLLWVLAGVAVAALVIAGIANMMSVRNHMEQVNQEVLGLAQQLGYTPDALLRHEKGKRDVSLVLPFGSRCMNQIFFETPMTAERFTERLNKVMPALKGEARIEENSTNLFDHFDFAVENADSAKAQTFLQRRTQTKYYWYLQDDGTISFYGTLNLPVTLVYKGHPLTRNVVEIYKNGGRFMFDFGCPIEYVEP
jgi:hypothetical protein